MKVAILLVMVFLSGCATQKTDFEKDWFANPEKVRTNNPERNDLLSYLGAQMLDYESRDLLIARLNNQYVANSGLKEGLVNGAVFSHAGDSTGVSIAAAQATIGMAIKLFSPGAMKDVSGIALPEKMDNKLITTEEEAWVSATSLAEQQLKRVAERFELDLRCLKGCKEERRVFAMTPKNLQRFEHYTFKPMGDIVVIATWPKLKKLEKPDVLSAKLRGFTPLWETPKGNMWLTKFFTEPMLDANGNIQFKTNEEGLIYPLVNKALVDTRLGRDMNRVYYADGGYMYMGTDSIYPGYLAFNGILYGFISENDKHFIEFEMAEVSPK